MEKNKSIKKDNLNEVNGGTNIGFDEPGVYSVTCSGCKTTYEMSVNEQSILCNKCRKPVYNPYYTGR